MLSHEEQEKYLIGRIGSRVHFTYPDGTRKTGNLVDRVACFSGKKYGAVYWNTIDLIRFEDEDEDRLRITYHRYRKNENKWTFAGQTSLTDPCSVIANLFAKAIKEKDWFKSLFKKAYEQCKNE